MKNILIYIFPILIPLLILVGVNEHSRQPRNGKPYRQLGIEALNTNKANKKACSWQCYNNTAYCKEHHVVFLRPYFSFSDPVYFGIIRFLRSTGDYAGANILFLVILWPLLMYWLLIKVILGQFKIRQLKKENR